MGQVVEPGGAQLRLRQRDALDRLHQIAEGRALRAARRQSALFHLVFVIRAPLGAHDDDIELFVEIGAGDLVVGQQHHLVQEVADAR